MGYEEADRQKHKNKNHRLLKSRKTFKTLWEICTSYTVCHPFSILIHFLQGSQYKSNEMQNKKDKPQEIAFFFC